MIGSEKQVAWAEKIRDNFIGQIDNYIAKLDDFMTYDDWNNVAVTNIPAAKKTLQVLREKIIEIDSAKFFIECVNNWKLEPAMFELEQTNFYTMDKFFKFVLSNLSYIKKGKPAPTTIKLIDFLAKNEITIDETWK